jgi:hypothetical protein
MNGSETEWFDIIFTAIGCDKNRTECFNKRHKKSGEGEALAGHQNSGGHGFYSGDLVSSFAKTWLLGGKDASGRGVKGMGHFLIPLWHTKCQIPRELLRRSYANFALQGRFCCPWDEA